ncbi:MAG: hypothetical protein M3Z08_18710 [Chloroflexota bacterium]|nr:hypothetical protein [Chloroflexota bacterium]
MEPLDTDMDYQRRPANRRSRLGMLFLFPLIGILIVVFFAAAGFFQINISGMVNWLMGFMILLFALLVILLFWGMAPGSRKS